MPNPSTTPRWYGGLLRARWVSAPSCTSAAYCTFRLPPTSWKFATRHGRLWRVWLNQISRQREACHGHVAFYCWRCPAHCILCKYSTYCILYACIQGDNRSSWKTRGICRSQTLGGRNKDSWGSSYHTVLPRPNNINLRVCYFKSTADILPVIKPSEQSLFRCPLAISRFISHLV